MSCSNILDAREDSEEGASAGPAAADGRFPSGCSWPRPAVEAGIPAITYEAGEPAELREKEVRASMASGT